MCFIGEEFEFESILVPEDDEEELLALQVQSSTYTIAHAKV